MHLWTLKYLWLTLRHKWFVFQAGLKVGAGLWDLITHDLSKLSLSELPAYGRQFYGPADDSDGFIEAWTYHQNRNKHHWEYWIPRTGHNRCNPPHPDGQPVVMPWRYVREMVADWLGASRAYDGRWPEFNKWPWLVSKFRHMTLHPETRHRVRYVLAESGYELLL